MATSIESWRWHLVATMTAFSFFAARVHAVDQTFCSTTNTGSNTLPLFDTYMSAGKCKDTCNGQSAYGVVQGNNCWCSNYAPGDELDASNCNNTCPGYPDEYCGTDTLFGYIAEGPAPFGTISDTGGEQGATPLPLPAWGSSLSQVTSIVIQTSVNTVVSTQMVSLLKLPSCH